jgi:hypothetical protein
MENRNSGVLDYPVSTGYRSSWGEWEAVREIVQNAIDSGSKVSLRIKEGVLTVRDFGAGFKLRNLLIGESGKDGVSSIGKFGEGMKFAFLTLLRMGCTVRVISNEIKLHPFLKETFGAETLSIKYSYVDEAFDGTRVTIKGISNSYEDRFLTLSNSWSDEILTDPDKIGKLFVKGIYVRDIQSSIAGYNLNMERENPMSGDIDMWSARQHIGNLIANSTDKKFIRSILLLTRDGGLSSSFEGDVCYGRNFSFKKPGVWRKILYDIYGTRNICYSTNYDSSRLAIYNGFQVIQDSPWIESLLKTDVGVVGKPKKMERVPRKDISRNLRLKVDKVRKTVEKALSTKISNFQIVEFKDSSIRGEAKKDSYMKISKDIVSDEGALWEVILHEMVHYLYGFNDLTHEFQNALGVISRTVIMYINDQE